MKSGMLVLTVACFLVPSLAAAQAPCKCSPHSATIIRPYFPIEYPVYPECHRFGRQHQRWPYTVNSTAGGVPLTVRNMLRTLDCLIPAGPRSGHGNGLYCIGAGSGCIKGSSHRDIIFCPYCGAPPFSCNCCGNAKAIYASPAPCLRTYEYEAVYEEELPSVEPQPAPNSRRP